MIEMMMQSMGVTADDIEDIKKLIRALNEQPKKIQDVSNKLDALLCQVKELDDKIKTLSTAREA